MSYKDYPHVFEPVQLGPIRLKNRIINLPMMNGLSTTRGEVTNELVAHMVSRARTGAGLVIIGDSAIDYKHAVTHYTPLNLASEENLAGFKLIADEVHRYGAKIGVEMQHGGMFTNEAALSTGRRISPVPSPGVPGTRSEKDAIVMDRALMEEVIWQYGDSADRLMRAGFDYLLVHCGHTWLLSQFLNKRINTRDDEYGGPLLENRMRFPLEVLREIHRRVGHKMAIDIRVSTGGELSPYAEEELSEMIEFIRAASPYITGANVSVMDISIFQSSEYMCQSYYLPHMVNTCWAERVKKAGVPVPVTATGSIVTVAEAEEILATGKADFVGMGRAGIVDNRHFVKAFQGREDEIRPCLRCAHCTDRLFNYNPIRCAVNPTVGRERDYADIPLAKKRKKVLIAGGGPAGMQAAQTCVERGHEVTLYEQADRLGGMLHVAGALPDKYDMRRYTEWMIKQTMNCGAKVVLNTKATPEIVKEEAPDAVLVAIGSVPSVPPIPGIRGDNVVLAADVDAGKVEPGKRVVILGAGFTGSECAIPLARAGRDVTLIDMISEETFTGFINGSQAWMSIQRIQGELGVKRILSARVKDITETGVSYTLADGSVGFAEADTVINALGLRVEQDKVMELLTATPESYAIGDCSDGTMTIDNAILQGFTFAMEL